MRPQWYCALNENCQKRLKINIVFITLNDVEQNAKKYLTYEMCLRCACSSFFSMLVDFVSN